MLTAVLTALAIVYGIGFGGLFVLGWVVSMMFEGRFPLPDVLKMAAAWPWLAVCFVWALIKRKRAE